MKSLHIALKDLRIRLRDRNTLVTMLLLPVALTAIIGFAFGGDAGISAVEFSLVAPEGDEFLTPALAGFLSQHEMFEADVLSEEEARRAVASGERSAAVVVPGDLLDAVFEGEPSEIRVLMDPASSIKAGIVRSMIEEFATYANAGGTMGRAIFDAIDRDRALSDADRWLLAGWMFQWMYDAWSDAPVSIEAADVETRDIDVHSYFAPGFAVLFLLFTMLQSAKTIHEERESGTYDRLLTAPVSRASFIAGKLAGTYLLAAIQVLLLVGLAAALFGVDWGSHPGAVVVMALVTAAGASSLAILIAAVARTGRQTDNVGTALILVMSLMGGSMWPIEQAPESFQRIARFTFNYWAHGGFKKLVFFDAGVSGIGQEVLVISVMSVVFFVLATRLLSRR
jgi:ABC-2 type transport system permease protein